ncbi:GNAT family N-acetyltransferase [Sediminispirochaeta smaragdinae]|uniref:GCN5-related N-acetyltransferase n=1 Tax=Sediminispirochaeta smaragdinae (strain DSM 11293 / JCM 15392 / SEBR 4228) TaxID=573413 RepID=E1R8Z3_SEDSS|nr:GNAT family N-acetyltransferase [Sediminispirochaeta smaragdinae]ADK82962.1 GCN5-related N-acetyltransferase [Sediminispirochaeta smaragdinae DSM 11293]
MLVGMEPFEIIKAESSHIPDLCKLLEILFSQEEEFCPDRSKQEAGLRMIIENPDTGFVLAALKHGSIVGMVNILFTVSTALGARVALLEDLIVRPEERRKGIGKGLITEASRCAKQAGCMRLTLLTDGANTTAHHFYQKNGFSYSNMQIFRKLL